MGITLSERGDTMKATNLAQGLLCATTLLTLTISSPASGFLAPGCPCNVVSSYHSDTREWVTEETTEAATRIIEALKAQTRQTSSHIDREVEASKRLADAEQQNDSVRLREYFRARAESGKFDPNPDYCLLLDMAGSRMSSLAEPPYSAAIDTSLSRWSSGDVPAVADGGLRLAAWLAAESRQIDEAVGVEEATTNWDIVQGQLTLPVELRGAPHAIVRLVANTVDPTPPPALTEAELKTPSGLSEFVIRKTVSARKSAARSALSLSLQLAMPRHDATIYRTLADRSVYTPSIPDMISDLQAIDIRTMSYFAPNADTLEERHGKSERALLQDLIDLQSVHTRINFLRLLQEMRNAAVLAAQLGILTDGERSTAVHR